jgi:hypothetical protein
VRSGRAGIFAISANMLRMGRSLRDQIERSALHTLHTLNTLYPFLEYGQYYGQVKVYLDLFPRANIRIYLYTKKLRTTHRSFSSPYSSICMWIPGSKLTCPAIVIRGGPRALAGHYLLRKSGIQPLTEWLTSSAVREGVRRFVFKSRDSLRMDAADRKYLCGYCRDDVQKLSSLLDRDLSA